VQELAQVHRLLFDVERVTLDLERAIIGDVKLGIRCLLARKRHELRDNSLGIERRRLGPLGK
jgi:hypothetical protein